MYSEKERHIHYYNNTGRGLYVTEFGHSTQRKQRTVGPYVRGIWLMHIVVQGVCRFCQFDVHPGECFLISKEQIHSFQVEPGYEHYWIGFDGADASSLGSLFHLDLSEHIKLKLDMKVEELHEMVLSVFESADGNAGERKAAALLLSLLVHHQPGNAHESGYVASACTFMQHNLHRRITMDEVAQTVNLSEKHLCRLFRQEIGVTPLRFLVSLRMKQARNLLEHTEMLVRQVAETVGFSSQMAFSAAFSAYWGQSPSEIRCNVKKPPAAAGGE